VLSIPPKVVALDAAMRTLKDQDPAGTLDSRKRSHDDDGEPADEPTTGGPTEKQAPLCSGAKEAEFKPHQVRALSSTSCTPFAVCRRGPRRKTPAADERQILPFPVAMPPPPCARPRGRR